ncbi:uncharacterized protein [Leptinotarsa decemlineata]|uniref:uncharacterized protein n=1 Tax=Leptinotarsa decemlineata TaxID=7539 RepID=UPI003D306A9D
MESAKPASIPLDTGYYKNRFSTDEKFHNEDVYRSAIGALLYLSVNTRPDICIATSILGRNVSNPHKYDWTEVKRIMKYLKGTLNIEIKLGNLSEGNNILYGFCDADWAGDKTDRKSNSGYLFKYMGAMFDWRYVPGPSNCQLAGYSSDLVDSDDSLKDKDYKPENDDGSSTTSEENNKD